MATITYAKKYIGNNLNEEVLAHSKWLISSGFILLCLGIAIVTTPVISLSLQSNIVQAGLLTFGGLIYIAHAMVFWRHHILGFSLHVLAGVIYILAGYVFFTYSTENTQLLAEIFMTSYLIAGIFRIIISVAQGIANLGWSWTLLCGVINIALVYLLWEHNPFINLTLINLIIGTELLFTGLALFMLGTHARREINKQNI